MVIVVRMSDDTEDWLAGVQHFRCMAWKARILVVNCFALLPEHLIDVYEVIRHENTSILCQQHQYYCHYCFLHQAAEVCLSSAASAILKSCQ